MQSKFANPTLSNHPMSIAASSIMLFKHQTFIKITTPAIKAATPAAAAFIGAAADVNAIGLPVDLFVPVKPRILDAVTCD